MESLRKDGIGIGVRAKATFFCLQCQRVIKSGRVKERFVDYLTFASRASEDGSTGLPGLATTREMSSRRTLVLAVS